MHPFLRIFNLMPVPSGRFAHYYPILELQEGGGRFSDSSHFLIDRLDVLDALSVLHLDITNMDISYRTLFYISHLSADLSH
jgi:hypothetical protein